MKLRSLKDEYEQDRRSKDCGMGIAKSMSRVKRPKIMKSVPRPVYRRISHTIGGLQSTMKSGSERGDGRPWADIYKERLEMLRNSAPHQSGMGTIDIDLASPVPTAFSFTVPFHHEYQGRDCGKTEMTVVVKASLDWDFEMDIWIDTDGLMDFGRPSHFYEVLHRNHHVPILDKWLSRPCRWVWDVNDNETLEEVVED